MSWLLSWGDCQHDWSPLTASGKGFCLYFRQTVLLHYIWSLQLLPLSASALNIVRMFLPLPWCHFHPSCSHSRSLTPVPGVTNQYKCITALQGWAVRQQSVPGTWLSIHSRALELNRSSDPVQLLWKLPINIQGLCWQACIRFIPPGQSSHLFSHRECPWVPHRFSGG